MDYDVTTLPGYYTTNNTVCMISVFKVLQKTEEVRPQISYDNLRLLLPNAVSCSEYTERGLWAVSGDKMPMPVYG